MAKDATATAPAKAKTTEFTVTATQDRVTKNAVRFVEDVPSGVDADAYVAKIGQQYVQKHALGGAPKRIEITVRVIEQ
jgi:hypothetical protein